MRLDEMNSAVTARFPRIMPEENSACLVVPKEELCAVGAFLRSEPFDFDDLNCATAVDRRTSLELVYMLYSTAKRHELTLKVRLEAAKPSVESLTGLWRSADWFEREIYDLFGIAFIGHPDLKRILNPDDWQGHPLRKDYSHPDFITKPKV